MDLSFKTRDRTGDYRKVLLGCTVWLLCLWLVDPATAQQRSGLQVYAHTLKHKQAHEALALVRPYLSARGTVEEQPGGNTLVVRDDRATISRIIKVLEGFDNPPEDLRFDIRIVRAGPKRSVVSPPAPADEESELSAELVSRLRELLRYDDYRVLAETAMTSREGEEVTYSLGNSYGVSFRLGTVMEGSSRQRLKLEDFRIVKHVKNPSNKGRQLKPRELFHATLNLWMDQPFNLVLAEEALMVSISCRHESDKP